MNRNVFITLLIIMAFALGACDAVLGGDTAGTEATEEVDGQSVAQAEDNATIVPAEPTIQRIPVVIAVQNIPRGTLVTPDRVEVVLYPIDAIPGDTFQEVDFVVNKIAATDIFINELLLSRKLVDGFDSLGSVGSDAAAILRPETVAVAVPIDRITSVAYALQPGDRVDVIVSMLFVDIDQDFQTQLPNTMVLGSYFSSITTDPETGQQIVTRDFGNPPDQFVTQGDRESYSFRADGFDTRSVSVSDAISVSGAGNITTRDDLIQPVIIEPSEQQRPRLVTQRTVTDAQVLYVGEFPRDGRIFLATSTPVLTPTPEIEGEEPVDGEAPTPTPVPDRPTIVTLAVRPQDAVVLTYMAEASIPMTFALRSARTQGLPDTSPVTLNYILQTYNIAVPETLNFGIEPAIRSIRGITLQNIFASGSAGDEGNVDNAQETGDGN
ncbi:MAG: RcpC/CpaB family pilus assembly protein [Chloroflexota bacterium]